MIGMNEQLIDGFRDAIGEVPDAYYAPRVASGLAFEPTEIEMAARAITIKPERVVEVGCGFGQLSMLIASGGIDVVGIDADRRRAEVAARIGAAIGSMARFACGHFPEDARAVGVRLVCPLDLLVFSNVASAWWRQQPGSTGDKIRRVLMAPALLNPATWFEERSPMERVVLAHDFNAAGFEVRSLGQVWHVMPRSAR
jgi:SAM-dependent methyltransferase